MQKLSVTPRHTFYGRQQAGVTVTGESARVLQASFFVQSFRSFYETLMHLQCMHILHADFFV